MKLADFLVEFDDHENGLSDPANDATMYMDGSKTRRPMITLRHINRLKKMKKAKMAEHEKRQELMAVMYALPEEGEEGM